LKATNTSYPWYMPKRITCNPYGSMTTFVSL